MSGVVQTIGAHAAASGHRNLLAETFGDSAAAALHSFSSRQLAYLSILERPDKPKNYQLDGRLLSDKASAILNGKAEERQTASSLLDLLVDWRHEAVALKLLPGFLERFPDHFARDERFRYLKTVAACERNLERLRRGLKAPWTGIADELRRLEKEICDKYSGLRVLVQTQAIFVDGWLARSAPPEKRDKIDKRVLRLRPRAEAALAEAVHNEAEIFTLQADYAQTLASYYLCILNDRHAALPYYNRAAASRWWGLQCLEREGCGTTTRATLAWALAFDFNLYFPGLLQDQHCHISRNREAELFRKYDVDLTYSARPRREKYDKLYERYHSPASQ